MAGWSVEFFDEAERAFNKLDKSVQRQVFGRIQWLADNFELIRPTILHDNLKGFFKLRAGDWRVLYDFDATDKRIMIYKIDHRSKVYKKKR